MHLAGRAGAVPEHQPQHRPDALRVSGRTLEADPDTGLGTDVSEDAGDPGVLADGQVRVSVSHPYQSLVGGILPGVGFGPNVSTAITMLADATMRPL